MKPPVAKTFAFKPFAVLLPCLAGAFALAGCPSNSENTAAENSSNNASTNTSNAASSSVGGGGGAAGKQLKLAFVTNNASDFWTYARRGTEKADKELPNVTVDFRIPGEGTAAEQTRVVNDLLATKIDGMAISPVDPANQTDILNKAAASALVFTQDSDAPKSNRACYIGTDNRAAGRQAGDLIKKSLPNGGKIMVFVGKKDAQNAADRLAGIQDAIKGSKVQIIDVRTDDTDRTRAKVNVSDTLTKYPDVAALVGLWSYNGTAIVGAVRDAGKTGKVKIIAFDDEPDVLAGIASGAIEGTVVQQPFEFGYQSIINMAKYLNGDKSVIPPSKQIIVATQVIDKSNVKAYQDKIAKLKAGG